MNGSGTSNRRRRGGDVGSRSDGSLNRRVHGHAGGRSDERGRGNDRGRGVGVAALGRRRRRSADQLKVGACQASGVGVVNDNRLVADEGSGAGLDRGEWIRDDFADGALKLAVLAAQVANLASLDCVRVARGLLATAKVVQVSLSRGTVAVDSSGFVDVEA